MEQCSVVLQDYHPIMQMNLLNDFFPTSKRYAYWNPIHVWVDEPHSEIAQDLPHLQFNPRWRTITLDLTAQRAKDYVVKTALELLKNEDLHGLFVDDLDVIAQSKTRSLIFLSLLNEIQVKATRPFSLFVNRGMELWTKLDNIDGIVLEGLSRFECVEAAHPDFNWYRNYLLTYLRLIKSKFPNIPIFGLVYDGTNNEKPPCQKKEEPDHVLSSWLVSDLYSSPLLNEWPRGLL